MLVSPSGADTAWRPGSWPTCVDHHQQPLYVSLGVPDRCEWAHCGWAFVVSLTVWWLLVGVQVFFGDAMLTAYSQTHCAKLAYRLGPGVWWH